MRSDFLASLADMAAPVRGLRVLLWGFSGRGFPGGDGVAEAVEALPRVGLDAVHAHDLDPDVGDKLEQRFDVSIVCNTRVGAVMQADPRIWTSAREPVYWFWDLRPGTVAEPLRGRPRHVFLSYRGRWLAPNGTPFAPLQWAQALGAAVRYCPQGAPLREPVRVKEDAPRVVFIGDLQNGTYHQGRRALCQAVGAKVLNARERSARLAIEAQMPTLYRSSRYCLSMSPLAPGYTSVRTYSILACGGLLVLHRFPGADNLFEDGQDCVMFDSVEELTQRLALLDGDEAERERIAANGRRLHATRHTVAHRILSICREVTGAAEGFTGYRC